LWVCANQEDEIVVIDPTGKVIAKLGDFNGIDQNGIARGLPFPGEPGFQQRPLDPLLSNLTLNLPFAGAQAAIDSAWTLQSGLHRVQDPAVPRTAMGNTLRPSTK
jgi:hypothetical protein